MAAMDNADAMEKGMGVSPMRRSGSFVDTLPIAPGTARPKVFGDAASDIRRKFAAQCREFQQLPGLSQKAHLLGRATLPCTSWLFPYDVKSNLRADLVAGCTVGVMVVPQSISYAALAGLPPIYGLYASLIPAFLYGVLGTSAELAVGPVAIVSLQVASGLSEVIPQDDPAYPSYCFMVALIAGCLQLLVGVFQMGFVINFLSHSVISGFTSGAAVIIGLSQLKYFGSLHPKGGSKKLVGMVEALADEMDDFHWQPCLMGVTFVLLLLGMKQLSARYDQPILRALAPLTVVVLGIFITWPFSLDRHHVEVVGQLPEGFPAFHGIGEPKIIGDVLSTAISVTFVGILESLAIAKALAAKRKYQVSTNRELVALGVANIVGSMFQAYPVTGSFSRSAVNFSMGVRTQAAGMVAASVVLLTLVLLTSLFTHLPLCALAAIIVSSVVGLFDYSEAKFLWRVKKTDFVLWLASFAGTLLFGVEVGIVSAVGISLLFVLYESAMPRTSVLGRLPGPVPVYRNAKQYPLARSVPGVLIFRVDSPIYFANVEHVKDKLRKYEDYHVGNSFSWLHHEDGGGGGGAAAAAQCQSGELALATRGSHKEVAAAAAGTPRRRRSETGGGGGGGGGASAISDVEQTMAAGEAARRSQVIQLDQSEVVSGGCYRGGAGDGSRLGHGEKVEHAGVVRAWIAQEGHPDRVRFLVWDLAPVTSVDSSAIHALKDVMAEYEERGIGMVFSNPNSEVLSTMQTAGLVHAGNSHWVFARNADAVRACVLAMQKEDIAAAKQLKTELSAASASSHSLNSPASSPEEEEAESVGAAGCAAMGDCADSTRAAAPCIATIRESPEESSESLVPAAAHAAAAAAAVGGDAARACLSPRDTGGAQALAAATPEPEGEGACPPQP